MALNFVDAMELESMRENDCSWRPCRISLRPSSSRTGIIVDFGSGAEDEFIYDQKDALSRLRFRSVPLQSDDCVHIKEGEHVLALQKTRFKSLFYDATIVEPKRVKHSKRVHCRCTFEIKWLNSERKGEIMIVPSQLILRLSDRSIEEHPVFTDFLKNLKSGSGGEGPSFLSFPEGSKCEADIVGILEKQVEQISKLFDGPKQTYTDLFSMVEDVSVIGAKQDEESVFSTASTKAIFEISAVNNSKIHQAIVAQKESEDKPVLTPLAARAALASLVHELPAKILCFSAEQTLKHKGLQEMDLSETIELPSFGAITSSTKSYYLLQNRAQSLSDSTTNHCNSEGRKHQTHGSPDGIATLQKHFQVEEKEAKPSRKLHGNKEDEHVILKNSRNSVNGEKLKVPASSRRITRSMLKTFADGNRSLQNRDISSDYPKGVHEMSSSSSDDFLDEIESTENSKIISQDLASSDNYGSKEKKSASVIMVRQIDSTPERKEPARKKRNRTPSDDAQDSTYKYEKKSPAVKMKQASSKKTSANPPLRSSPRFSSSIVIEKSKLVARSLVTVGNNGIKENKSTSIIMVRQKDSTPGRKEPRGKKRGRTSSEDEQDSTSKYEEKSPAVKMKQSSSKKNYANPPLRSSPRFSSQTRSKARQRAKIG